MDRITHDEWREFRRTQCPRLRERIVTAHLGLAKSMVLRRYRDVLDAQLLDELIAAAQFGLLESVDRYDPDRGVKFSTWCVRRVLGAAADWLRQIDPMKRGPRRDAKRWDTESETYLRKHGSRPTPEELAETAGVEVSVARRWERCHRLVQVPQLRDGEREAEWHETLQADWHEFERRDQRELAVHLLDRLDDTDQAILWNYYIAGLTMREIGESLGLSESRVSQRHKAVLARFPDIRESVETRMSGSREPVNGRASRVQSRDPERRSFDDVLSVRASTLRTHEPSIATAITEIDSHCLIDPDACQAWLLYRTIRGDGADRKRAMRVAAETPEALQAAIDAIMRRPGVRIVGPYESQEPRVESQEPDRSRGFDGDCGNESNRESGLDPSRQWRMTYRDGTAVEVAAEDAPQAARRATAVARADGIDHGEIMDLSPITASNGCAEVDDSAA